jgi:hypothetical protein
VETPALLPSVERDVLLEMPSRVEELLMREVPPRVLLERTSEVVRSFLRASTPPVV